MNITDNATREGILEWAKGIKELLNRRGDKAGVDAVNDAIGQFEQDRFLIAVLGKAKRGKSTLINAVLGRRDDMIAPVDKLPASNAITRFIWGETEQATVFFRNREQQSIAYDRVGEFVTEEQNPANRKDVDVVEVSGPFAGLNRDLVIVDTPGAGSIHEHHDALLQAFIPQADAVIFMVTARMPLDQDELNLLKQIKSADVRKLFFVVNRIDESSPCEIDEAIAHNRALLSHIGIQLDHVHRISAKNCFQRLSGPDAVPDLMSEIGAFLGDQKGSILNARLVSRVRESAASTMRGLAVELASSHKSDDQLDSDVTKLEAAKAAIKQERGLTEREFMLDWERAVDHFERSIKESRGGVKSNVLNHISSASLKGLGALAKDLPSIITKAIEDELTGPAARLETSASAASRKLQASYPVIEMRSAGEISLRSRGSHHVIVGGVGGAAAVATGIGLATAGSAAAVGIAAANASAMAAATAASAAPTALAGLGSLASALGAMGVPYIGAVGSALAGMGATATAAAPIALTATPLWVALSGPVGWTLAGIGVLTVPFAWRASKLKQREHLENASVEQIKAVYENIESGRIGALRKMGTSIIDEFRIRLDRELIQIESGILSAKANHRDPQYLFSLSQLAAEFEKLLSAVSTVDLKR